MLNWIKRNKLSSALLLLLFVSNTYVGMVVLTNSTSDKVPVTNETPQQINQITDSEGFSINGDVINQPAGTKVVNQKGETVTKVVTTPAPAAPAPQQEYIPPTKEPTSAHSP